MHGSSLLFFILTRVSVIQLLYVDNIILTRSNFFLHEFISHISSEFSMKDLGPLHYFLGIQVIPTSAGMVLSQEKYAFDLLERAHMVDCKPLSTPVAYKAFF